MPCQRLCPVVEHQRVPEIDGRASDHSAAARLSGEQRRHVAAGEECGARPNDKVRPLSPGGVVRFLPDARHAGPLAGRVLEPRPVCEHGRDRLLDEGPEPTLGAAIPGE